VFEVGAQPYACPIARIQRLLRFADVSMDPSPAGAPAWEVGRLALENDEEGIPVVSLRALWGFPVLAETAGQKQEAILIVSLAGRRHALLVDVCPCVIPRLPEGAARFLLSPALQSLHGRTFKLATPWKRALLVVLELDELLESVPGDLPAARSLAAFP
jgi:chemotaxis signal transduction protein